MLKVEVFDPAMCCSTGICGSSDDPKLVTFASDLEWLKMQGVEVARYGLSLDLAQFAKNEEVKKALDCLGEECLPIIALNKKIVSKGMYPSREKLAELCKIEFNEDEAPPVHREENCCCGIDCDCTYNNLEKGPCSSKSESAERKNYKLIAFIIALLILVVIIVAQMGS